MGKVRKFFIKALICLLIIATYLVLVDRPELTEKTKAAGTVSSVSWSLSSDDLDATATYTLTFTTENDIPTCSSEGQCGSIEANMNVPPSATSPFPSFTSAKVTVARGATTYINDQALESWSVSSGMGWLGLSIINKVSSSPQSSQVIPAGTITVTLTNVKNPSVGGVIGVNVLTSNNGNPIDGNRMGTNSSLRFGTVSLSGKVVDGSNVGVGGVRVEVHSQFGCAPGSPCFWQTTTSTADATKGNYEFAGIPAGNYIFEMSPSMDFGNQNAADLNKYAKFDPIEVAITAEGGATIPQSQTQLIVSQKKITGVVKYSGTNEVVKGASINAFSMGKGGFAMGQSGSDGAFTLTVGAGANYFVMIMPAFGPPPGQGQPGQLVPAQDFMPQQPKQISFQNEGNVAETADAGAIYVDRTDATVTGKLVDSNGATVLGGGMGAQNFQMHTYVPVNIQNGNFSFKAKSGSGQWQLEYFDMNNSNAMPDTKFAIKPGNNDLGTIKMLPLDKTITVTAKRKDNGATLPNIPVMAFSTKKMGPPFMAQTGSDGVATIKVMSGFEGRVMSNPAGSGMGGMKGGGEGKGPGGPMGIFFEWVKHAMAQEQPQGPMNSNMLYPVTPPKKVKAGDSVTFEFALADKPVSVTTVKKGTNPPQLMADGSFVNARPTSSGFDGFGGSFGGSTKGGIGTIYTTAGEFEFNAFFPPESDYIGIGKKATIGANGGSVAIEAAQKTVTVTGSVLDASNNNAVIKDASLNIMIGIFSGGAFGMGKYNPTTGTYTAKFAPGIKFRVGVAAGDPGMGVKNGGYIPNINPTEKEGKDGETITFDISLAKVDAVITGKVTDQDGKAVEGVNVFADPGLADIVGPEDGPGPGGPDGGPEFGFSATTDANGDYTINVAPNKYNLVVNARDKGLFTTGTTQVTLSSKETKTVNLSLAKADSSIEVQVKNQNGANLAGAEVQVFNDKGTIAFNAPVADDGKVKIDVPADSYTIKAGKDSPEDGVVEESAFSKVVTKKGETSSSNLQTITQSDSLAKPVTQDVSSDSPTAVSLSRSGNEEATLNIPTGALTSSSTQSGEGDGSSAIITVSPLKAQAVATKADYPIKGISIEASQGGTPITTLSGIATGEISYKESDLPAGIKEADLEVKAFNENSGQWEKVSVSSVDADSNVLTFATTHFTDFAIVSAAPSVAAAAAASSSTTTEAILPATGKNKDNSSLSLLLGGVGILLASGLVIGFRRKKSRI